MTEETSNQELSDEAFDILDHTVKRAARSMFCGGGRDMDALVAGGLMRSCGKPSWCPDEYFTITDLGRQMHSTEQTRRQSGATSCRK